MKNNQDKKYFFSGILAEKLGINESIILSHLFFWIKKNKGKKTHTKKTRIYTRQTVKQIQEKIPFFKENLIYRTLQKLEKLKIIEAKNFNFHAYDKTKWYSIIDFSTLKILMMCEKQSHVKKSKTHAKKSKKDFQKIETGFSKNKNTIPDESKNETKNKGGTLPPPISLFQELKKWFSEITQAEKTKTHETLKDFEIFKYYYHLKNQKLLEIFEKKELFQEKVKNFCDSAWVYPEQRTFYFFLKHFEKWQNKSHVFGEKPKTSKTFERRELTLLEKKNLELYNANAEIDRLLYFAHSDNKNLESELQEYFKTDFKNEFKNISKSELLQYLRAKYENESYIIPERNGSGFHYPLLKSLENLFTGARV